MSGQGSNINPSKMAYRNRYTASVVEDSRIIRPPQTNRPSGLRAPQARMGTGIPSVRTGTTGIPRSGLPTANARSGLPKPQIRRPVLVTPPVRSGIPSGIGGGIRRLVQPTMVTMPRRSKSPPPSRLQPRSLEFGRARAAPVPSPPVHVSPVHTSPVHMSPVLAYPVQVSPVHTSPVHTSPVHTSPVHTSPVYASPVHASPVYGSPVYTSPGDISQISPPPELDMSSIDSCVSPANLSNISQTSPPPGLDLSGAGSMLNDSFQEAPLVDLSIEQTLNELRTQELREKRDLEAELRTVQDARRKYYMQRAANRPASTRPMNPYTKLLLQRIEEYGGYVPDIREEEIPEVMYSEEMEEELDPIYEWNQQPYSSGAVPASTGNDLIDLDRDPWTYSEELYRLVQI